MPTEIIPFQDPDLCDDKTAADIRRYPRNPFRLAIHRTLQPAIHQRSKSPLSSGRPAGMANGAPWRWRDRLNGTQ